MSMGNRIARLRQSKGYTQEFVAESLGISRQAVYKWEKGQSRPDTGNLIALAAILDTNVDYLINGKLTQKPSVSADSYFKASLFSLIVLPVCWLIGIFSGAYTEMVQIPIGMGVRMGIPFLMYGHSPLAIVLVVVSIIGLLLFILLLILGHLANRE